MNWHQRAADCRRRHEVVYPEFLIARNIYQRLDRCCTYWSNQAVEADRRAKEEEGSITFVPANETKATIEKAKERFKRVFEQMPKDQQAKLIKDLIKGGETWQ